MAEIIQTQSKDNPFPLGADFYYETYIKTGRVLNEKDIRLFMATLDLILNDNRALELAIATGRNPDGPEAKEFYEKTMDNLHRKWDHRPVRTHEQICKEISLYKKGLLQTATVSQDRG